MWMLIWFCMLAFIWFWMISIWFCMGLYIYYYHYFHYCHYYHYYHHYHYYHYHYDYFGGVAEIFEWPVFFNFKVFSGLSTFGRRFQLPPIFSDVPSVFDFILFSGSLTLFQFMSETLPGRFSDVFGSLGGGPNVDFAAPCQCFVRVERFSSQRPPDHKIDRKKARK